MEQITRLFRKLPLIGPLAECSFPDHWNASREIVTGLVWSMMPIWLGTFVLLIIQDSNKELGFCPAFLSTISGGELLIYAASLLAPVFWMALHDPPGAGAFPSKLPHIILTVMITVFAAVTFGLQRSGKQLNPSILSTTSRWLFLISIALLYLATVYHNRRLPNPRDEFQSQEKDFLTQYRERKP